MKVLFRLIPLLVLTGCLAVTQPDQTRALAGTPFAGQSVIVPGKSFGPVTRNMSEKELIALLGASQVVSAPFYFAEGNCLPGTRVFPNDPEKSFVISWVDPGNRKQPAAVRIKGEQSAWKTPQGISLGTTVRKLEALNGKAFLFTGFSWDYEGLISRWQGGALDGKALSGITLHLACCDRVHEVYGDKELPFDTFGSDEFSSSQLAQVADLITVDELTMHFPHDTGKGAEAQMAYLKPCEELEGDLTIR